MFALTAGFLFCFLHQSLGFLSFVSFTLFIRNADELKPRSVSWVSFLHLFNTPISHFSLQPTTCSLISCSDGRESTGVDWLVPSQGSFGPVFLALQVCVSTPMKHSVANHNGESYSVTWLLFMSKTPAQDICFIPLPFWLCGTFRRACPDPNYSVLQLEGSLDITGISNRKMQQRNETNRSPWSEPEGTRFLICFVIIADVCFKSVVVTLLLLRSHKKKRKHESKHWNYAYLNWVKLQNGYLS